VSEGLGSQNVQIVAIFIPKCWIDWEEGVGSRLRERFSKMEALNRNRLPTPDAAALNEYVWRWQIELAVVYSLVVTATLTPLRREMRGS
jgi:hypothetical protein